MEVTLERHTFDVDTYHRMIEAGILTERDRQSPLRVELIHGEIIQMSPIGILHIAIVDRISNLITRLIGEQAIVRVQSPIVIPDHSEPESDITLLKPSDDFYATQPAQPEDVFLMIEVADTTWNRDYEIKRPLYATAGVPELWLVNVNKHEIEVHRNPVPGTYKSISILQSGDELSLPVPDVSATVSVDDLLGPRTEV
ncbi:Uma2 family endonuclease [Tunicatimonas pelagia]|uniref:Uma2 family endonuclease n=1 Tax=Tunicatimonas pelagia TaxID=931531 RepID=UPI0026669606|nr:Uma2 family endonuclease [Tunicatimonas pelagia]WKN44551.1 Uma2 family endonuclease [Tunicatimonas pelagia]